MVNKVLVLGGGSAGFLAAISVRAKFPTMPVTVAWGSPVGRATVAVAPGSSPRSRAVSAPTAAPR